MASINALLAGISIHKNVDGGQVQSPEAVSQRQAKDTVNIGLSGRKGDFPEGDRLYASGRTARIERAYGVPNASQVPGLQSTQQQQNDFGLPATRPAEAREDGQDDSAMESTAGESPSEDGSSQLKQDGVSLTEEDKQLLAQLKAADRRVKNHEAAHIMAAGGYAKGGASFQYKQGPDGKKYAVSGEVAIDIGRGATPKDTITKMRTVRRAALAPADPSSQDQRVAARATLYIAEAVQELRVADADANQTLEDHTDGAQKGADNVAKSTLFEKRQGGTGKAPGANYASLKAGRLYGIDSFPGAGENNSVVDLFT